MNRPLIIMDMPALCGRSSFTFNGRFKDGEGEPANITVPIFRIIKSMMRRWETDRFFFCWDGDESYRQSILPCYTSKFHDVLRSESHQMRKLKDLFLFACGFENHYTMPKHGSNDCIYNLVRNSKSCDVVVRSFDEYHFHLFELSEREEYDFCIENSNTNWIEFADFRAKHCIDSKDWFRVLAIVGSTLHNMPGVPTVGMKRAVRVIRGDADEKSKIMVAKNRDIVERNVELIVPVENIPPEEVPCRKRMDQIEKTILSFGFTDSWTQKR